MRLLARGRRRLATQVALSFVAIVLLTAVAAWIPEIWLIRDHFERETWARVEQGRRATRALYGFWEGEVTNAAILLAQLPALQALAAADEGDDLPGYLRTVETSLDLDVVLICNRNGRLMAQIGTPLPLSGCAPDASGYRVISRAGVPQAWLLATQAILRGEEQVGSVVAGIHLDDEFAQLMQGETGLEHTLLVENRPIATSFAEGSANWPTLERRPVQDAAGGGEFRSTFRWQGKPYFATRLSLGEAVLAEIALSAEQVVAIQQTLLQTLAASVGLVILLVSVAGFFGARRIAAPLVRLTESAARLSRGDLSSPVSVESALHEVDLVAQTLEQARIDLQSTLTSLEREKAWIEHLLQAIVEGIVTLDEANRITFFSAGAERITGWKRGDVLHRHCDDVFQLTEGERKFSELIPVPGERQKMWVELADRQPAALSITRAALAPPEAEGTQAALVFRDVSEEEAVQQLIGHFLANISHEFRTPLTALEASVELLVDQAEQLSEEELQQMLNWLHLGILNLQTLVDNLLASASLEAGRFRVRVHRADLKAIVGEATQLMKPLLEKYDQELAISWPSDVPLVYADEPRIVQVLVNLLSNANKYAPERSQIQIAIAHDSEEVKVLVSDEGPGIPPEQRQDLFHRFLQSDSKGDRGKYGIGLGLWVVKAIVEEHGGQVGVEEGPAGKTSFWFTLKIGEDR